MGKGVDAQAIKWGCYLMAGSIGLGAFGAHGLKQKFTEVPQYQKVWETATNYSIANSLGLVLLGSVAAACSKKDSLVLAKRLLIGGTTIFSGSLYGIVLSGKGILGAVTPIGGIAMMAGWVVFGRSF